MSDTQTQPTAPDRDRPQRADRIERLRQRVERAKARLERNRARVTLGERGVQELERSLELSESEDDPEQPVTE